MMVGMLRCVVVLAVVSGCGRIAFDAVRDDDSGTLDGAPARSCLSLPVDCGPASSMPCCESPVVTGGTFYRGYDVATDGMYTDMTRPATVRDFRLDRYEVTVGRFRQFVTAGGGTQQNPPAMGAGAHPHISGSGWDSTWNGSLAADTTALTAAIKCGTYQTWTDTAGANENRPILCIDWFEAMAFCAWDGGFLPTEAEWQYAASGGMAQRAYPWSTPAGALAIDCNHANYKPGSFCVGSGTNNVGATSTAGDGVWGQADLAGNAWEWVLDYQAGYSSPCNDCANLFPAPDRVIRGGGFDYDATTLRVARRDFQPPSFRGTDIGLRCGRTP